MIDVWLLLNTNMKSGCPFRNNKVLPLTGNDVTGLSSLGGAASEVWMHILQGRLRLYISVQSSQHVCHAPFPIKSSFTVCRKWHHSVISARGRWKWFLNTDFERATLTLYSCCVDMLYILNCLDVIRLSSFGCDEHLGPFGIPHARGRQQHAFHRRKPREDWGNHTQTSSKLTVY